MAKAEAKPSQAKPSQAFTLVELSIVIVIIGLIVAGITAGKSLVSQASLRDIMTDVTKYTTAYNTFKIQYNGVPGDITNASSYWPTAGIGNGNGLLETSTTPREDLQAWDHLAKAGLIQGTYTGVLSGGFFVVGLNVPPGPYTNSSYVVLSQFNTNNIYGKGSNINAIRFSNVTTSNGGAISGVNAAAIDTKMDDGKASLGKIVSAFTGFGAPDGVKCVTGSHTGAAGSSDYIMTDNAAFSCVMQFWIGK